MKSRRVLIVGGGPAGLFLARLLRRQDPGGEVVVFERNPPDATYGFGVVLSERTMSRLRQVDPATTRRMEAASVSWTDMELRHRSRTLRYPGHGLTAISRRTLLRILQEQAAQVGARLEFGQEVSAPDLCDDADVVVLASGAHSAARDALADVLGTETVYADGKYIWFGTHAPFTRVTFAFAETEYGAFAGHGYPYEEGTSTFIVTTDSATWRAAGAEVSTWDCQARGESDAHSQQLMAQVFRDHLAGAPLLVNNTRWTSFRVVHNRVWWHRNLVLLGDAAHTAHPSVGSGTKIALEDAIALAGALAEEPDPAVAFAAYERRRRPVTTRTQELAAVSMRWWDTFGQRVHFEPRQLGFHFLTRTDAMSYAGLRRRDPAGIADLEAWFAGRSEPGDDPGPGGQTGLAAPLRLGRLGLPNRLVRVVADASATVAYAVAGCGLVIADWTAGAGTADWAAAAQQVSGCGAVAGALIPAGDHAAARAAAAAGLGLLAVALDPAGTGDRAAVRAAGGIPLVARLDVPAEPVWSDTGVEFARRCDRLASAGVAAFHLGDARDTDPLSSWTHLVGYADRIRAGTRRPVAVDGPEGWALERPAGTGADDWPTRMHVALLAGRLDLVATWPLPGTTRGAASARTSHAQAPPQPGRPTWVASDTSHRHQFAAHS